MRMREISGRKRFTRIYLWYSSDTCGSCHTFHPIPSPVRHYGSVFICHVRIQPAVLGGEGWENVMQYYYRSIQVPYILPINVHPPDSVLHTL